MTFFEVTADRLESYAFGVDELRHAQAIWRDCIAWYCPGALDQPQGLLGELLAADTGPAAIALIDLAQTLARLRLDLTEKSVPVFEQKVRELFRMTKKSQFDELVGELTVGAAMTTIASPIALEPYVAIDASEHEKARSPDYAISTPDGPVAVEVTTLRVEAFERWERLKGAATERLRAQVWKRQGSVSFELKLPLSVSGIAAGDLLSPEAIKQVFATETGSMTLPLRGGEATLTWKRLPRIPWGSPIPRDAMAAVLFSGDEEPGPAFSASCSLDSDSDEMRDLIFASLRQTLRRKRSQHAAKEPYFLILQLGHRWIPPAGIAELVNTRIWPNKSYQWVAGIAVFTPRNLHGTGIPYSLECWTNPNADPPVTPSFDALTSGAATYHAPRLT